MTTSTSSSGKALVWGLFLVLFVAHQDFWLWDDGFLVLGFMPIGLAYHALFSIACSCLWALAVCKAWPEEIERWADDETSSLKEEDER